MSTTIIALSTPPGTGGIAVIRISGSKTIDIMSKLISGKLSVDKWEPRKLYNIAVNTAGFVERGLGVIFRAPNSYTGEDLGELHVHGSMAIVDGILRAAGNLGAVPAARGEFSMRAFLHGKIDLTAAEGIRDLINSETEAQITAAQSLTGGKLYKHINQMQSKLSELMASIEVIIDYPEEDIAPPTDMMCAIEQLSQQAAGLLDSYKIGHLVKNGVKVAIVGEPNVGKSTLFNALLGSNRAIVSQQAGTTRDTLSDWYIHSGVKFELIDTAGLRDTDCLIEQEGIIRARQAANTADFSLLVVSASAQNNDNPSNNLDPIGPNIVIYNKSDLVNIPKSTHTAQPGLFVSALTGHNIDKLKDTIYLSTIGKEEIPALMLTSNRQYSSIADAKASLEQAKNALITGNPLDCISVDLFGAYKALGKITGKTAESDIVGEIFAGFCVGK